MPAGEPTDAAPPRLVCDEQGEGRPVVVVPWGPGGFGSLYRWVLQPLASRCRLIHWDYRGCGGSSPGPRYSMEDDLWDLLALMDSLELEDPVLLGHSYGGMVSLYLATEYPDRVGGLVLVNTMASAAGLKEATKRRKQRMGLKAFKQWEHLGMKAVTGEASGEEKLRYLELEAGNMVRSEEHVTPIVRRMRINFEVLARVQESLQAFDVTARVRELDVPALVTAGAHDRIVGEEPKALHRLLKGSRFHRFMESGHLPFLEEPAAFTRVVTSWLEELGKTP